MSDTPFEAIPHARPSAGLVLRVGVSDPQYLRLTHIFDNCVYCMWISDASQARYARRPKRLSLADLKMLETTPDSTWGRLALPPGFIQPPEDSSEKSALDSAWRLIEPLITAFEKEENLARNLFTALIHARAEATSTKFLNLARLVKRYYYFGGVRIALMPLPRGTKPGDGGYLAKDALEGPGSAPPKRRGRQPILADELGRNDFVVGEEDIADMVACLKSSLRKGKTFISEVHENYLAGAFRRRHPNIHAEYLQGKRPEPVTARQFRYYMDAHASLSEDLASNLRTYEYSQGFTGAVRAIGPGEVYEIDATGGRLHLVTTDDPPVLVGKPTIYLMIDRWSRFVVSAYLSLRPASYEEVRYALLIAFTSRATRFRPLGIDIDDTRWPIGRMPAVMCSDRGAEFVSDSLEQSVVQDLHIELTVLPPLCPDGKAIVERLNRELKRRMANTRMKGVYADRPLDPETKRAARKAEAAAMHSLTDGYRTLIEIIHDHNTRPHSALKRMRKLTQAGVKPIPKDAYLWGLEHLTGLRTAPLSDTDYQRLLLSTDSASASKGQIRYSNRPYMPVNELAHEMASRWARRAKSIQIRVDKTVPQQIFVPTARREWAIFQMTPGTSHEIAGLTLDEEAAFAAQTARLWARADHASRIQRIAAKSTTKRSERRSSAPPVKLDRGMQQQAREDQTADLKRKLTGKSVAQPAKSTPARAPAMPAWSQLEEEERLRNLALIRQHRSKR